MILRLAVPIRPRRSCSYRYDTHLSAFPSRKDWTSLNGQRIEARTIRKVEARIQDMGQLDPSDTYQKVADKLLGVDCDEHRALSVKKTQLKLGNGSECGKSRSSIL